MKPHNSITYEELEVRLDDKPNKEGFNVRESLQRFDFRKDPRINLVPTEDLEVRRTLLLLNEPESNDGEDVFTRRERLIELLLANKTYMEIFESSLLKDDNKIEEEDEEEDEDFFTPASEELKNARRFLVQYSTDRAKRRLHKERQEAIHFDISKEIKYRRALAHQLENIGLLGSQIASSRPISSVKFSPDDKHMAVGSWDGSIKTISARSLNIKSSVENAHIGKVGEVDWNSSGDLLATGGEDGSVKLFTVQLGELRQAAVLRGHERRVAGCRFHPCGRYIASASFDNTWRLWDAETNHELLLQEGHGKEVFCLAFQSDGSLLCSAGLDCTGMIWDIRSGNCAMVLSGHTKPIYSVDWSPRGFEVATASGDGTVNIWDIRKTNQPQVLLAHNNIVSGIRFEKYDGKFLMSCGYDKNINVYSGDNWNKITVLKGHTDKILALDVSKHDMSIVSAGWDRSVKSWNVDN